jgi:hypothetical protein
MRRNAASLGRTRLVAFLAALAYSAVLLHGLLPGSHEAHSHELARAASMVDGAKVSPSPVCPHRLPELHLDGHIDCALCKLTRSAVAPDARSDECVAVESVQGHVPPSFSVPSNLEYWQPANRRGPPVVS